jgi:hypothetical protein
MEIKFAENTLRVSSPISKDAFEKGYVNPVVTDDKGNTKYTISFNKDGKGAISKFGIAFNTVDAAGNLAMVDVLPVGTTTEQVSLKYGDALIAAKDNLPIIAANTVARQAVLAGLFTE